METVIFSVTGHIFEYCLCCPECLTFHPRDLLNWVPSNRACDRECLPSNSREVPHGPHHRGPVYIEARGVMCAPCTVAREALVQTSVTNPHAAHVHVTDDVTVR